MRRIKMKMAEKIKIDMVSDVVCPWCIVGYKRMERAIVELGIQDQIELEWQPFELNPNMPPEGQDLQEHLHQKYGTSPEQNKRSREQLTELGVDLGFEFNFYDNMRMPNTKDAHILLDYALKQGLQTELNLRLISAHFSEQKDISNPEVLAQELKTVGLNIEGAMAYLSDTNTRQQLENKEEFWKNAGINAVPTMVFDRKSAITGAQAIDVYKRILNELLGK